MKSTHFVRSLGSLFLVFLTAAGSVRAATVSWLTPAGGDWSVATNWSGGAVPTVADDVQIVVEGEYTVDLATTAVVRSLTLGGPDGAQTLVNHGQVLRVTEPSRVATNGILVVAGGVLGGTGVVGVDGTLRCTAGTLEYDLRVGPTGLLALEGAGDMALQGSVTNLGRIVWFGPGRLGLRGARIDNRSVFEIQNDQVLEAWSGVPLLANSGRIRKTGGGGLTRFDVALDNIGALEVQTGWLLYAVGSVFRQGTDFTGAGTNLLATPGVVTLEGTIHSDNLHLGGASVAGICTLTGQVNWTAEWLNTGAEMTVAPGATLTLSGPTGEGIRGTLINAGHIVWSGTGKIILNDGRIHNQAGAVFEIQNDQWIETWGGSPQFVNAGILRKAAGQGVTLFAGVPLDNTGILDVGSGWISHAVGSVFRDGTAFTGAGTNLLGTPGAVTLEGTLRSENLHWAASTVLGTATLTGTAQWTGEWLGAGATLTVAPGATLRLRGNTGEGVRGTLINAGLIEWSGDGKLVLNDGRIHNQAGATFNIQNDQWVESLGGNPQFINDGRLRKSSGPGVTLFVGVPMDNSGTLEAQTGWISYGSGSVFRDGTAFVGAGTNLLATPGAVTLEGTVHSENLQWGGATIAGTCTLTGTTQWTSEWLGVGASVTIAPSSTLILGGPAGEGIRGTLVNHGHLIWSGTGNIVMDNGVLENRPDGQFEIQNNQVIMWQGGSPRFLNAGSIRKTAGSGVTRWDVPVDNTGDVEAGTGWLIPAAGSVFRDGTRFTGAGTNLLAAAGVVILDGSMTSENLEFGGAILTGTNTLSGTVRWIAGYLDAAAAFTVASNATLSLAGPLDKGIVGVLHNHGRIRWSDAGNLGLGSQTVTATLHNAPGAVFEAENDAAIAWTVFSAPVITNAGTFRKVAGTNVTTVSGVPFINTGLVEARSGTLAFLGGYTQTGGALRLGLRSQTRFGRIHINGNAPLTGTLAADLYDGFRPRAGDSFPVIAYTTRTGAFTDFDLPTVAAWETNAPLYEATQVRLSVLNSRPTLSAPADTNLVELTPWSAVWVGADLDTPANTLTYSLLSGPTNATIHPTSGLCTWTPAEAQGPGTNVLVVSVADDGVPSLTATQQITLVVREVNQPPHLVQPPNPTANEEAPFQLTLSATDDDLPANPLAFALVSGPTNASVDPTFGRLTWTPTEAQGPGTHSFEVRVTDDSPQAVNEIHLSHTNSFTVTVHEVNRPPELVLPGSQTTDEMTSWIATVTATDPDLPPNLLTYSLVSAPEGVQLNPNTGVLLWTPTEDQGPGIAVIEVAVTDVYLLSVTNQFTVTVREVNRAPNLAPTPDLMLVDGLSLHTRLGATDPDLPANSLVFDLLDSPAGAQIDPSTGDLTWTPAVGPVPSTNTFNVQVTDTGTPPATAQRSFRVTVLPPPTLHITHTATEVWLSWPAAYAAGQLQSATDLTPPIHWQTVTNVPGMVGDSLVVARPIDATQQYYRLEHR